MAEPPLLAEAVKLTVACALPAVAAPIVGALGTPAGVTLFEAADAAPVPIALLAVTVQVTAVPLANPLTVSGDEAPVLLSPPQVAVYPVMALPPLLAGAVKLIVTWVLPAVAVPMVGAPGTPAGVTLFDAADAAPAPFAFAATTLKV